MHGAIRRLSIIKTSFLELIETTDIRRTKPLSDDEVGISEVHLNSILIHIHGMIDCLLWATLYQGGIDPNPFESKPQNVRFNANFFKKIGLDIKTNKNLLEFENWLNDFKRKRNASAHKIPFYVPPSSITKDELSLYSKLEKRLQKATMEMNFEEHEEICKEMENLGTFGHLFAQDHTQEPYKLYPTIPDDICQLLNLTTVFINYFKQSHSNS